MLEFQCPGIDVITVSGELDGLYEPVYQGRATRHGDWLLETKRSIRTVSGYGGDVMSEPAQQPYSVANLTTGMQLETARSVILETFGELPQYDANGRVMTLNQNGCMVYSNHAERRLNPDGKCLKAWSTLMPTNCI